MDQIKFLISSGVLKSGQPLPSTRSLSTELGVNPMTISKAYSFLEREGVVERRPGRPLVVKAVDAVELHDRKIEQLKESLFPSVAIVRQLEIPAAEARRIFTEMLEGVSDEEEWS
ncbi:MAG: GntR family transcriptional regulator [Acidobacteriota bacterium]|nr:MAG: GntR family transcriptional regulator [Acidobacteriota bacterium]